MTTDASDPFSNQYRYTNQFGSSFTTQEPDLINNPLFADQFQGFQLDTANSPLLDILEFEPEIPFQGALQRSNPTPNQLATFRNQRQTIFNQFLATLDEQIRAGQAPSDRFADFIGEYDFGREFERFAPGQRAGGDVGRFAPPTRVFRR